MQHFYESIPGWTDNALLDLYVDIVKRTKPHGIVIEVGSWLGRSAAFMAVELIHAGKHICFHAVDTWDGRVGSNSADWGHDVPGDMLPTFIANMTRGGVMDIVRPIRLPSVEAAAAFNDGVLDAVFIDADHVYDHVKADILAWKPKVKSGGWLCGHDYKPENPGVMRAVDELLPHRTVRGTCWLVEI